MASMLYVDDEQMIGLAVSRWLKRRGHTVHLAPSIAEAQALLATHEPDVLLIDVWLGSESGFELMSWIEDTRPALARRVTFVTGELADGTDFDRLNRSLGRPVLQKPFDLDQIEQLLRSAEQGAAEESPRD